MAFIDTGVHQNTDIFFLLLTDGEKISADSVARKHLNTEKSFFLVLVNSIL